MDQASMEPTSRQSLSSEIELFYSQRRRLAALLAETEDLFDKDFAKVLSPDLVADIQENLALTAVKERVGQLFQGARSQQQQQSEQPDATGNEASEADERPCIIIVGQTKSGKSSFINELLGGNYVRQSSDPCTARVTKLTYTEGRLYFRTIDRHGRQLGDTVYPDSGMVDDSLIKLAGPDRENPDLLSSRVEVGVPSDFLRHGIDVVDSPGLNENAALDSLTMAAIDSFLPIILYVIDGQYGVTLAAEKDIQSIRASAPGVELFYLVTKMDVAPEDAPEPGSGLTVEDIENERARRVFVRLQRLQCLAPEDTVATCRRFFCLSSWEMRRHRRKAKLAEKKKQQQSGSSSGGDSRLSAGNKWVQRFDQVRHRLAEFAGQQFCSLVVGAGSSLLALHSQTMDVVMSKANDIRACALMRRKNLERIRAIECRNHDQSKKIVDSHWGNFSREAETFIAQQSPVLLEDVKSMEYSSRVIGDSLSSNQIEERCIAEIQEFINNRIVTAYQDFLKGGAMGGCFDDLDDLKARVLEYEKDLEQTPSLAVLRATLVDDCSLDSRDIYCGSLQTVMRQVSHNIRTIFRHPGVIFNRPVRDPEWKRYQARSHIKKIDTKRLVDCLVTSMHQWLDKRHFNFLAKIRCSEQLVENAASLSELERQQIVQLSPKLSVMYTRCLAIVTGYRFRGYCSDPKAQLGCGAQGQVCAVRDPSGQRVMAAKMVTVDADNLGSISSEVFYSSILRHPNLVRVEGVRLTEHRREFPDESSWAIELYMELMHSDLWSLMQRQQLPLGTRIWFGHQLAKALEFLHSSDLIHRDVKLQNLLIDREMKTVKLTDFGLTKSAGLTGQSLVGTPIYLAPEMVTNSCYDTSADVYSLGIALWYLAEGSGRRHPDYVEVMPSVGAILLASSMNSRPNRLPSIPDDLWDLMERCWHAEPAKRPPSSEVAAALDYIGKSLC